MYLVFIFRTIFNPVVGPHSLCLPYEILPHIVNILYFFPFAVFLGELRVWLKPCFDLRKGLWLAVCSFIISIDNSVFHRLFLLYNESIFLYFVLHNISSKFNGFLIFYFQSILQFPRHIASDNVPDQTYNWNFHCSQNTVCRHYDIYRSCTCRNLCHNLLHTSTLVDIFITSFCSHILAFNIFQP